MKAIRPEPVWRVDEEYQELYASVVDDGRRAAATAGVVFVGIARNAMPYIENTLALVEETSSAFAWQKMFVFENDSADGTDAALDDFASSRAWVTVCHETTGEVDNRGFEDERTFRLARCRNKYLAWVRENAADAAWTVVLDLDPHGGFSPEGVLNSVGWLARKQTQTLPGRAGGMASYSLWVEGAGTEEARIAHYDAWAARPNWWRDRREEIGFYWLSTLLFPVGAPPMPMNSAFGGLCVYDTRALLSPGVEYAGGDCEHVALHRKMHEAGYQLYLNPGCRYIAHWQ